MKKLTLSVVLVISLFSLNAQDLLGVIFDNNIKANPVIETELESVVAKAYSSISFDDGRVPDTLIVTNGDTSSLYLSSIETSTYDGKGKHSAYTISHGQEMGFYINRYQDKQGLIIKEENIFEDKKMASFMNNVKTYSYDDQSRLINVYDGVNDMMKIEYENETSDLPIALEMNAGFAIMRASRVERNDSIIYLMSTLPGASAEEDEDMMAMIMAELNKGPKQYMLYQNLDGNHHYQMITEDEETREPSIIEHYVRTPKGRLLEKKDMLGTWKYVYDKDDKLISTTNIDNDITYVNEYDASGNLIVEYQDGYRFDHSYDEKNHLLTSQKSTYGGAGISEIIIYQNTYRK